MYYTLYIVKSQGGSLENFVFLADYHQGQQS